MLQMSPGTFPTIMYTVCYTQYVIHSMLCTVFKWQTLWSSHTRHVVLSFSESLCIGVICLPIPVGLFTERLHVKTLNYEPPHTSPGRQTCHLLPTPLLTISCPFLTRLSVVFSFILFLSPSSSLLSFSFSPVWWILSVYLWWWHTKRIIKGIVLLLVVY